MQTELEKEILRQLQANQAEAVKILFDLHYDMVLRTASKFFKDQNQAKDIAQMIFIKIWDKRTQLNIQGNIQAYIRRMAINTALTELKKQKRLQTEDLDQTQIPLLVSSEADEHLNYKELKAEAETAINQLPPKCQQVFKLSRYELLTYKEIAKKMDISVKTVENQMGRAFKLLRKSLKEHILIFFLFFLEGF